MRFLIAVLIILTSLTVHAQVVNIESQRLRSDTTGWKGSAGTAFSLTQNVQQIISIDVNAHLQYKTKKNTFLLVATYNLLKAQNEQLSNNMFYHFRINHQLNTWLLWEAFTQLQQNVVTGINLRLLAGTGPRFRIRDNNKFSAYAGTSLMNEHERERTDPVIGHTDLRSSNYLSLAYKFTEAIGIITTSFYQPLYRKLPDFRFLNETALNIKASKHLIITASLNYLFDAFPAAETPRENYIITNGFTYLF